MPIQHTKKYGIYHWDTFDNATSLIGQKDTIKEVRDFVEKEYGDRLSPHGADRVDVVDLNGNVVEIFRVR